MRLSFSSEEPVHRSSLWDDPWIEILGHDVDEVDLTRLLNGAPVLYNHDRYERENRIGVVERAWLENGRGEAEIRISRRDDVEGIWQDIMDRVLVNVSVGYQIHERQLIAEHDDQPNEYRVSRWSPMEISLVDIPADPNVGVGRSDKNEGVMFRAFDINEAAVVAVSETKEERAMPEEIKTETTDQVETEQRKAADIEEGRKLEAARRKDIQGVFEPFGDEQRDLQDKCIDDGLTVEQSRQALLTALGKGSSSAAGEVRVEMGESAGEKFRAAAMDSVEVRTGLKKREDQHELLGYSLFELARKSLEINGIRTGAMDKMDLVGRALTSTSDFPYILSSNAKKSMLVGYTEEPETFTRWTKRGNLSDFKIADRVGSSLFTGLDLVSEGGEYQYGKLSDIREQIKLATYGKLFAITREAIIGDDLSMLSDIPQKMGRAARRKVGDLVYAILIGNPTMSDTVQLFHASHNNLLTGAGSALAIAGLGDSRTAMSQQQDPDSNGTLGIRARYLIVPDALEDQALTLMSSERVPGSANNDSNIYRNRFEVVSEHRLDGDSTTAWYHAADPMVADTIEVAYLDGNDQPAMEQQGGWSVDGVEFKVRIDAAAKATDFRGMVKNAGA